MLRRSARAAPSLSGSTDAGSGSDSPVRALRSKLNASARNNLRSAGTTSPVRSSTMSPGTRSRVGTSSILPPRRTLAVGAAASRRASSAFSPLYSVTTPAPTMGASITRTSRPSRTSFRAMARQPAMNSRMTNGSRAPSHNSRQMDVFRSGSSSLGPNWVSRAPVSSGVRPCDSFPPSRSRTASAGRRYAASEMSAEDAERGARPP